MLEDKLVFEHKEFWGRKPQIVDAKAVGQKIFIDPKKYHGLKKMVFGEENASHDFVNEAIMVPSPEIRLQFLGNTILLGKQEKKIRFTLAIVPERDAKEIPASINGKIFIETTNVGKLEAAQEDIHFDQEKNCYCFEISKFHRQKSAYIEFDYSFTKTPEPTKIIACIQSSTAHVIAELNFHILDKVKSVGDVRLDKAKPKNKIHGIGNIYEIEKTIHQSVSGTVLLAKAKKKKYTLKIFEITADDSTTDNTAALRFYKEGLLLTKYDHPNIVKGWEFFTIGRLMVLVMEYLEGKDLEDEILDSYAQDGQYSVDLIQTFRYFFDIAVALDFCHFHGVYHRDLKPKNIRIVDDKNLGKRAVLMDFNNAKTITNFSINTNKDGVEGTLLFLAPEYLHKSIYDVRSEIFAFAINFYIALSGKHPFINLHRYLPATDNQDEVMQHNLSQAEQYEDYLYGGKDHVDMSPLKHVREGMRNLIEIALQHDHNNRLVDMGEMSRYLFCYIADMDENLHSKVFDQFCKEEKLLGPKRQLIQKEKRINELVFHVVSEEKENYVAKFSDPRLYSESIDDQEEFFIKFKRQNQILNRLYSEHVVKNRFVYCSPDISYFVMDRAPGMTMTEIIKMGYKDNGEYHPIFDEQIFYRTIRNLASTLTTMNSLEISGEVATISRKYGNKEKIEAKVFHRNIEPSNILLDEDGNCNLVGFGQARNSNQTRSIQKMLGNTIFLAPEYREKGIYGDRSDIFSLGICFYLMLTGYHPFLPDRYPFYPIDHKDSSLIRIYEENLFSEPDLSKVKNQDIRYLIKSALTREQNKRATAENITKELNKILEDIPKINIVTELQKIFPKKGWFSKKKKNK